MKLEEKELPKGRSNLFTEQLGWRFTMVIKLLFNDRKKKQLLKKWHQHLAYKDTYLGKKEKGETNSNRTFRKLFY